MSSVLLPNKTEEQFDPSKCFVTLDQIEKMITEAEQKHDRLIDDFNAMGDTVKRGNVIYTKRAVADMIIRAESKISTLKDVRHMAYVTGGYRQE